MLITTGAPYENGLKSEVIDLLNPNTKCQFMTDFNNQITDATGGLIESTVPIICGGFSPLEGAKYIGNQKQCWYMIDEFAFAIDLIHDRHFSSSVILNNNVLWITGGNMPLSTNSSEFVRLNRPSEIGPVLPLNLNGHCMTKINDTHVIITGGVNNKGQSIIVDVTTFEMILGPRLSSERSYHACESFHHEGRPFVVVAGGFNWDDLMYSNTIEYLDITNSEKWQFGKYYFWPFKYAIILSRRYNPPVYFDSYTSNDLNKNLLYFHYIQMITCYVHSIIGRLFFLHTFFQDLISPKVAIHHQWFNHLMAMELSLLDATINTVKCPMPCMK